MAISTYSKQMKKIVEEEEGLTDAARRRIAQKVWGQMNILGNNITSELIDALKAYEVILREFGED